MKVKYSKDDDCVFFKYIVPRGEAYDKKYNEKLRAGESSLYLSISLRA